MAAGQFSNGTPERMPVPDKYYLPAIKIVADIGKTQFISNSSYYNRDERTGYQGTAYDLAYYQSQSWLIGSCGSASTTAGAALLVVSADRRQRHPPAGRIRGLRDAERHHQPAGNLDRRRSAGNRTTIRAAGSGP